MDSHILEAFLNSEAGQALLAGLGSVLGGAYDALKEKFQEAGGWDSVNEWIDDLKTDWLPDASAYDQARDALEQLWENAKTFGEEVVSDIGDAVNDILDTGEVAPQTDGGLGETYDIFKPEAEGVPEMESGDFPGVGSEGGGMNRDYGGGGGYADSGSGGGSSGGTTPLGDSSSPPSPDPYSNQPTAEDLGLDPDGGATWEYHPNEGEVVITYPDGTVEVRPWP